MNTKEILSYRHVVMYAKDHYVHTDLLKDLGIILGKRSNIDPEYYYDRHPMQIVNQLLPAAYEAIGNSGNPEYYFTKFIEDSAPENNWKVGGVCTHNVFGQRLNNGKEPEPYSTRVIRSILSIFRNMAVIKGGERVIELGDPDPSILPLSKGYAERIEKFGSVAASFETGLTKAR